MDLDPTPAPDRSPDQISSAKSLESVGGSRVTPQTANAFESHMQGAPSQPRGPGSAPLGAMSPMEAAAGAPLQPGTPTINSLSLQAKNAQDSLGVVGQQLNAPNLKLKRSQSHLLRNKLQDANTYIRSAGAKLDVETPAMKLGGGVSPVDRFISYVSDGQNQLLAVQQKLKDLAASGTDLRPGDMLLIQIKMNLAQQEIEYSSTLLGKVIDSLKQIMSIQL